MTMRALILIAGLFPLTGCVTAAVGAAGAVGVAAFQDKTLGESLDDANASNELKARLMTASAARYNEVDVEVAHRTALLSGRVPTQEDRLQAERIAWSVGLINDVANEIQVRDQGGIIQNVNDEWITARVRSRLFADDEIKSVNVNIETYDGIVYLMGRARTPEELRLTAEHASKVRGVKEVVSFIQLRDTVSTTTARQQTVPPPSTPGQAYNPYAPGGYSTGTEQDLVGGPGR